MRLQTNSFKESNEGSGNQVIGQLSNRHGSWTVPGVILLYCDYNSWQETIVGSKIL